MKVEFFPKVNDRLTHRQVELSNILSWATTNEKLKNDTTIYRDWLLSNPEATKTQKSEMKVKHFTAVTFSGSFSGTGKTDEIIELSSLFVLDFDHLDVTQYFDQIKQDPLTNLLFVSPSNDGLKVVIKHDLTDPTKWSNLYGQLEEHYRTKHHINTDPSGKDISRMCFIPFIDKLYRNENSRIWNYVEQPTQLTETNETEVTEGLLNECMYLSKFLSDQKINVCDNYQDWLNYGFSLCFLGENGREFFHNISSVSSKYNYKECNRFFDGLNLRYDPDKIDINYFLRNVKEGIVQYILYKQYGYRTQ